MKKNGNGVAVSALYTAGVWRWGRFACADFVTPADAEPVFRVVNAYMRLYRLVNPRKFPLRHQLLHRHSAIDHVVQRAACPRVVEVGCGLSARGSRLSADPDIEYVEIDLPEMVAFKRDQLEETPEGRAVLARDNFQLRAGDIVELDFAASFSDRRTAVVTEGLMMYFERDLQLRIWRRIAALCAASGGVYIFDYIPLGDEPPRSPVGHLLHVLGERLLKKRSDFAYDGRSRHDVADDLRGAGFAQVEIFDTGEVAARWGLPKASVATRTLIYRCTTEVAET